MDDGAAADGAGEVERVVSDIAITQSRIRFQAGEREHELVLVRNDRLLAPDAVVVRDGVAMTPEQAGLEVPYRGYVAGDPNSWIRVRVTDSGFEGLIYMDEGLWDVRQSDVGEFMMAPADIDDYVDSPNHGHHACATSDAEAAHATSLTLTAGEPAPGTAAKIGCQQIDIALVADYTHVAKLGGASAAENEMLMRLNETDGIYRADLNYGFSVEEIRTFAKSGGPAFNQKGAGALPLDQFSEYKQSQYPELGLAHLFVARTTSGTVGLAWIGSTCSASKGTGVSNYLGKGKASTVIVAHEIGHNFGSPHDSSGAPYIMAPSVDSSVNEFSDSSENKIDAHVGSVSCFTPCDAEPQPDPEQPEPDDEDGDCVGFCGEQSSAGCWCDSLCSKYGDCCEDKIQTCG